MTRDVQVGPPRVLKYGIGYDLVVQGHAFDAHAGGDSTLVLGIRCHTCQRVSFHRKDVEERYCGACHVFHDQGMHGAE